MSQGRFSPLELSDLRSVIRKVVEGNDLTVSEADPNVIYAGTGESAVDKLIPLICDEIKKVCDSVTAAEVMRARTQLKASVLMSLESPSSRCEQLARQVTIFNRPIPVSEMISKIEAIDRDAVRAIAQRLTSGHPTLTALGPAGELPSFESFAERLN